jgi:hypothetical protein
MDVYGALCFRVVTELLMASSLYHYNFITSLSCVVVWNYQHAYRRWKNTWGVADIVMEANKHVGSRSSHLEPEPYDTNKGAAV